METIDLRSKGRGTKLYTFYFQLASSIIFLVLSLFLLDFINFFYLFIMEAVGQLFLAIDNKKGLDLERYRVIYFSKSPLSSLALLSFALAVIARALIAIDLVPHLKTSIIIGTTIALVMWIFFYLYGPKRKDIFSGAIILTSSFLLAYTFYFTGTNELIAYNLISYSAIILIGALFLKPWVAEFINIIIWSHLFYLVIL